MLKQHHKLHFSLPGTYHLNFPSHELTKLNLLKLIIHHLMFCQPKPEIIGWKKKKIFSKQSSTYPFHCYLVPLTKRA